MPLEDVLCTISCTTAVSLQFPTLNDLNTCHSLFQDDDDTDDPSGTFSLDRPGGDQFGPEDALVCDPQTGLCQGTYAFEFNACACDVDGAGDDLVGDCGADVLPMLPNDLVPERSWPDPDFANGPGESTQPGPGGRHYSLMDEILHERCDFVNFGPDALTVQTVCTVTDAIKENLSIDTDEPIVTIDCPKSFAGAGVEDEVPGPNVLTEGCTESSMSQRAGVDFVFIIDPALSTATLIDPENNASSAPVQGMMTGANNPPSFLEGGALGNGPLSYLTSGFSESGAGFSLPIVVAPDGTSFDVDVTGVQGIAWTGFDDSADEYVRFVVSAGAVGTGALNPANGTWSMTIGKSGASGSFFLDLTGTYTRRP